MFIGRSVEEAIQSKIDELLAGMTAAEKAGQLTQYFYFRLPGDTDNPALGLDVDTQPLMVEAALGRGEAGSLLFVTNPGEINRLQRLAVEGNRFGIPVLFGFDVSSVTKYYFLFLLIVVISVVICYRLERSRIGRAWMAIREDEVAAKAMGINTRNMKLLAFAMGASFGGVAGVLFSTFQRFISPESFALQESVMVVAMVVLGGIGHIPGVILGALLLAALPEVLRWVSGELDLQMLTGGRLDASILRQLLIALAMIGIMLARPRGLWPSPEHGKLAPSAPPEKVLDDPSVPQPVGPNVSEATNVSHPSGTRHA
jgi:ABC-type uncharacterized transport system permease subunit